MFRAPLQFLRRAVGHDPAAIDDDGARTGRFDFLENVRRENDRLRFRPSRGSASDFVFLIRVEAVRRLVHDEHFRVVNDRLRETGAMPITFRERLDALMKHRIRENTSRPRDRSRALFRVAAQTAQLRRKAQKAMHRHVGVGRRIFRQITDEAFRRDRILEHVESADGDFAARRRDEAGDACAWWWICRRRSAREIPAPRRFQR